MWTDPRKGKFITKNFTLNYRPFYVGKGHGHRKDMHKYRSNSSVKKRIQNIVDAGLTHVVKILKCNLTEEEAFAHEKRFIALFGRKDLGLGPLLNRTNGGYNEAGAVHSITTKALRAASVKEGWDNLTQDEYDKRRLAMSAGHHKKSAEEKEAYSDAVSKSRQKFLASEAGKIYKKMLSEKAKSQQEALAKDPARKAAIYAKAAATKARNRKLKESL